MAMIIDVECFFFEEKGNSILIYLIKTAFTLQKNRIIYIANNRRAVIISNTCY
jgi:hypothetical protein